MKKYGIRVLMVFVIFLFGENGMELSAQSNLKERETIKIEHIKSNKILFVDSEIQDVETKIYKVRDKDYWNGAGDVLVKIVITYERIDRLPTRSISELVAIFTAGVSFLQ